MAFMFFQLAATATMTSTSVTARMICFLWRSRNCCKTNAPFNGDKGENRGTPSRTMQTL